jgi:hypothetical protein
MAVRIESEEVTESLNSDHCAGDRFPFRNGLPDKYSLCLT